MIVESGNPAHSLADGPRMRQALAALELLVVIDVAMTETARLAHYVLPVASQFEKAEATFFNFEFPHNYFHVRRALMPCRIQTSSFSSFFSNLMRSASSASSAICLRSRKVG